MKSNPSTHTVYEKIVLVTKRILQVVAALLSVGVLLIIFYCWFGNPVTFVTAGPQMNQHTLYNRFIHITEGIR